MAVLSQVVICNLHSMRNIPLSCVVQLLDKLFIIIYKIIVMYIPACSMQESLSTKSVLLNCCPVYQTRHFSCYTSGRSRIIHRQSVAASFDGCISKAFSITNGVRQGGVSLPIIFNVYMN